MLPRMFLPHTAWCAMFLFASTAWSQTAVLTQRYDDARTGANLSETTLTTSNVTVNQFGKLFTLTVDGSTQASMLYVSNVPIAGKGTHNVLYVATMNDKLYAFDADSNTGANAGPLWMDDFTNSAAGITPVPIMDITGSNSLNIVGNVGIESTPVIDLVNETMYLVARTKESGNYLQRLHAIDIRSGVERPSSPVVIQATVPGTGAGSVGGKLTFDPKIHNQRSSLALANGKVLIAWASHEDLHSYYGWVMAYDEQTLAQAGVFCPAPNDGRSGIWESGWAPAVDASGNAYYMTGNGLGTASVNNLEESVLKFDTSSGLNLTDWFTPSQWLALNGHDVDLSAAGGLLIPGSNLILGGGKEAVFFLLDTGNLGHEHAGNTQIVQQFAVNTAGTTAKGQIKGGPIYWDRTGNGGPWMYVWAENDFLKAYHFNGATFDTTPASQSTFKAASGNSAGVLTLSANGSVTGTGIVWSSMVATGSGDHGVHQGILRAFDASDLTREIWDSGMNSTRDNPGNWPKFSTPLVVNGKVYLGSFSNRINVFGLLSANPDFSLSSNCGSPLTVNAGGSASCAITVTPLNGFSSAVSFSASGLPSGATATFTPASVSGGGTVTLTITTSSSTPSGTSSLTITASGGKTHSIVIPFQVSVPGFAMAVAPTSQSVNAGTNAVYTVSVTSTGGFSDPVTITPSGSLSVTPASCIVTPPGSCTFTVSTTSTPANTYTLTFTGTSGSLTPQTITASLTVTVPNLCVPTTAPLVWTNTPFASKTGTFTALFDATPGAAATINDVIGLSQGAQTNIGNFPVLVSFSNTGHIVARNGGAYTATNIVPYIAGQSYHFRLVVNVTAHTYSIFVTPPGGAEAIIGANFAFRTGVTPSSLNSVGSQVDTTAGALTYCNFSVN